MKFAIWRQIDRRVGADHDIAERTIAAGVEALAAAVHNRKCNRGEERQMKRIVDDFSVHKMFRLKIRSWKLNDSIESELVGLQSTVGAELTRSQARHVGNFRRPMNQV